MMNYYKLPIEEVFAVELNTFSKSVIGKAFAREAILMGQ
jgi:hypothetical protein